MESFVGKEKSSVPTIRYCIEGSSVEIF